MTSTPPTAPAGTDAAAETAASASELLAQLLASQEQARNSQSQHELGRKQLPALILQLARLAGQQQSIEQESRQRLAEARSLIKSIASSATQINESMSQEYQSLLALLNNPQALAQLSSSAAQLATVPSTAQTAGAPQPAVVSSPSVAGASADSRVPALQQLRDRLLQAIRTEAERRIAERAAPIRHRIAGGRLGRPR